MKQRSLSGLFVALACLAACSGEAGEEVEAVGLRAETPLPARRGTVIVDGCVLDTWSRALLAQPATKRVVAEVVMLCLVPRESGEIGPRDLGARTALTGLVGDLRREGYTVELGIAFTDESGQRYDGAQTARWIRDPFFRGKLTSTIGTFADIADGIDIDLQRLPNESKADVSALVSELSAAVRPLKKLGLFAPPSVTRPSDLPGGEAFETARLAPLVDRVRVMTLDYSENGPGPTIDAGWAVDAVRLARREVDGRAAVDVAVPLYGIDFGPRGLRPTTWFEAVAIASSGRLPIERGPTGSPFVRYARDGEAHVLWFDDAISTARALGGWTYEVLPADVGVVFYGLGAEEPTLFAELAARTL